VPSAVAVALVVLTISLGNWQGRRAEEKLELSRRLDESTRSATLAVPATPADASEFEHRKVSARGRYLPRLTLLLDNKVQGGVAGYHVLTPLKIEGGDLYVLINRGWIAAGDRRTLPKLETPEGVQTIAGVATVPTSRFLELAQESAAGPVRQNLVLERERQRLALPLQPFVVQQTNDAHDGLMRAWERPDTDIAKHRGYALQWYAFAVLTLIFYVLFSTRRG
jgi:surfeit locus 1 family protein